MTREVSVYDLVKATCLHVFTGKNEIKKRFITVSDVSRPGLELTGYFDYYPHERIQIFGLTEISYLKNKMNHIERQNILNKICAKDTPALVVSRQLDIPEEMFTAANNSCIPILGSPLMTIRLSSVLTEYLESKLAPRKSLHGVLVEIYGLGVLIIGDSGIGKSEIALELIKRGHRLIADDRVDIYQQNENTIVGEAPKILKHLLEIRGIGIIDVMNLFGAGAVRDQSNISLIINLVNWSSDKVFDRLGTNEVTEQLFDVKLPKITIPVKVGRDLSTIIEVAAMNFRAKSMGFDATKKFEENLSKLISKNNLENKDKN